MGSIPWATSKSTRFPWWRGASRSAGNIFTPWPRCLWPFYHRLAQSDVFGFENRSCTTKVSISDATAFRPPRHEPLAPRPTLLSCARAAAMCSNSCAVPRRLGVMTQGAWSFVHKLKKAGVRWGLYTCIVRYFVLKYGTWAGTSYSGSIGHCLRKYISWKLLAFR